eukprot:scaffold16122_cov74-Phaeocystis_antarctica.AAC.1
MGHARRGAADRTSPSRVPVECGIAFHEVETAPTRNRSRTKPFNVCSLLVASAPRESGHGVDKILCFKTQCRTYKPSSHWAASTGRTVGSVVLGWRALRPPRVVFVIAVASLINLSLQAKQCREVARAVCVVLLLTILGFDGRGSIWGDKT